MNRPNGYGRFSIGPKMICAHRVAFEAAHGPIQAGMEACHRCDTPTCVNPVHMFLGTHTDNMQDAWKKGRGKVTDAGWPAMHAAIRARTRCRNGHPFEGANLRIRRGIRECVTCSTASRRAARVAYKARKRAKRAKRPGDLAGAARPGAQ